MPISHLPNTPASRTSVIAAASATALPQLEGVARRYATLDRDDAERLIDEQVGTAIREWRVADATFWQRVKFRSRMIRTATAQRAKTGKA